MFKNVASQKIQLFAFDTTTGTPKSGDAANLTAYVSKDHGSVTVLGDTSATEMDATNAKGVYLFDLTQGETNADELTFTAKSTTSNISITPRFLSTTPPNFTLQSIDSNGRVDAIKIAGTTQTAGDVFGRLGAPAGASMSADIAAVKVDTAAVKVKTDFLPTATAGAAGGVFIAGTNAATAITTALTANIIGNVTGNLSGSVGSVAGDVGGDVLGGVVGDLGGNVVGSVGSVAGLTAADVGAIKTQTDQLAFGASGAVDANITHVIADPVQTNGSSATNWGGAL